MEFRKIRYAVIIGIHAAIFVAASVILRQFTLNTPKLPIADGIGTATDWFIINASWLITAIKVAMTKVFLIGQGFFIWVPWPVWVITVFFITWQLISFRTAIFLGAGLVLIKSIELWESTMLTLSLLGTAATFSILIGIPIGIICAKNERIWNFLRPILDAMQTTPSLVYLVPVVMILGVGAIPGIMAAMIFATPPCIRNTYLGIRRVPPELREAGNAFGATPWQLLTKVEIPNALPNIMLGVNQTTLMSISCVVVAAFIGARGLGMDVLNALGRVMVGLGFEAGLAVLTLAIVVDRLTQAMGKKMPLNVKSSRLLLIVGLSVSIFVIASVLLSQFSLDIPRAPIANWIEVAVSWFIAQTLSVLTSFKVTLTHVFEVVQRFFIWVPWPVWVITVTYIAWRVITSRMAIFLGTALLLIQFMALWKPGMETVALLGTAAFLASAIGIPIGILCAINERIWNFLRPILDAMQTIPSMVYLLPVVMLLGAGAIPGIITAMIFATPPCIRNTYLGIRRVSEQLREAGKAFGASRWQLLTKVEIPNALPNIMLGVNQAVLVSVSTVTIAAFIGAGALGYYVLNALGRVDIGASFESGLAVLIVAIVLDRLTQTLRKVGQPKIRQHKF